jgi:hypothetical protein
VPPAPSMCLAAEEGTGGEGASGKRGDGPSAPSRQADNARKYPFEHSQRRTPIGATAHNPRLCFQAKNLLIRAIHGNNALCHCGLSPRSRRQTPAVTAEFRAPSCLYGPIFCHFLPPHRIIVENAYDLAQARYAAGTREILECWFEGRRIRDEYLIVDGSKLAGAGAHSYSAGDATGGSEEAARFKNAM